MLWMGVGSEGRAWGCMEPSGRRLIAADSVVWRQRAGVWAPIAIGVGALGIAAAYGGGGEEEGVYAVVSLGSVHLGVLTWAVGEGQDVPGLGEGVGT